MQLYLSTIIVHAKNNKNSTIFNDKYLNPVPDVRNRLELSGSEMNRIRKAGNFVNKTYSDLPCREGSRNKSRNPYKSSDVIFVQYFLAIW
jgi:hypothetical protein